MSPSDENPQENAKTAAEDSTESRPKRSRLFSAKEFRKRLESEEKSDALLEFLNLLNGPNCQDVAREYLENGGSVLEILHFLETDVQMVFVFEVVTKIMLVISSRLPQHQPSAHEACRHLLNNHTTLVNKMLGLSSSQNERKIMLKLLTVLVTLSPTLAKDVLLKVNFNETNLELLTKNTTEQLDARHYFIQFLTAFIVDDQYPTLAILLGKRGLLTSIVSGLQYDDADCVCMVIVAMKTHILENPLVSKTTKLKTFNTQVLRNIVNLYNWKGKTHAPSAHKTKRKQIPEVDQFQKSKVSQVVHEFLLVLCTSLRHGVIFRDKTLGLANKHENPLMYTVLESLDRPWEHSFASELVIKIVRACPDLARTLWSNLKPYLEPRKTEKWLRVLEFTKKLLGELEPNCIEFCARDLSPSQLAQAVQFLIAPTPVLKTLIPKDNVFENPQIKYCVFELLAEFLKSVDAYVDAAETWLKPDGFAYFRKLISEHIERNFPNVETILEKWESNPEQTEMSVTYSELDYLKVAFQLLNQYKKFSPQMLESLGDSIDFAGLFKKMLNLSDDAQEIFVKITNLVVGIDATIFLPTSDLFGFTIPILLRFYHSHRDQHSRQSLFEIFKGSTIFFGCVSEIYPWIDAVVNVKNFDEKLSGFVVETFRKAYKDRQRYLVEDEREIFEEFDMEEVKNVLEEMIEDKHCEVVIEHVNLSPLVSAAIENFQNFRCKSVTAYFNCIVVLLLHLQTKREPLQNLIAKSGFFDESTVNYVTGTASELKTKGTFLKTLQEFLNAFQADDFESYLKEKSQEFNLYPDHTLNLLQLSIFQLTNLIVSQTSAETQSKNCLLLLRHLQLEIKHLQAVLGHPVFLEHFQPLQSSAEVSVGFVVSVVRILKESPLKHAMEPYLNAYRSVIQYSVLKAFKKLVKPKHKDDYENLVEILEIFEMEREHCENIITKISQLHEVDSETINKILQYCLRRFNALSEDSKIYRPLAANVVVSISKYLAISNREQKNTEEFAENFLKYLQLFPHDMENVSDDLFPSVLSQIEYCKQNAALATFLFCNAESQIKTLENNIENVCNKKGLILPLLSKLNFENSHVVELIFTSFKPAILKALQKPQKAGQHFQKHFNGVSKLLERCFPKEEIKSFVGKVHKFEVSEVFHAHLLSILFVKHGFEDVNDVSNSLLTLIHLALGLLKKIAKEQEDDSWAQLKEIAGVVLKFIGNLKAKTLETLLQNESFQLFCRLCLKFGISSKDYLLNLLAELLQITNFTPEHASDLLEMIGSHSEFLEVVLNTDSARKKELMSLILLLCEKYPQILQRNHVPVLLSAYYATLTDSDRTILRLLKLCEQHASATSFYDFKPFLWGSSAAGHYSVRADVNTALWRQPKFGDVLDLLRISFVLHTIKHFPLNEDVEVEADQKRLIYDLSFLLPVFSHILAPQNAVQTYKFTRSGAMALTVAALGSEDEDVRSAAAFVLYRFYHHQEARQTGKDNVLWLRYIEAICKGAVTLEDLKLNTFAAVFFARISLVLSEPGHVMYVPVSNYLVAKSYLNLSTIPELYTLLHSSDVHFKDHRSFILNILCDGIRSLEDFEVALRSMSFKLLMELYDSCVSDSDTKVLVLSFLRNATRLPYPAKLLCSSYGLLPWLSNNVTTLTGDEVSTLLPVLLEVVRNCVVNKADGVDVDYVASFIVSYVLDELMSGVTKESVLLAVLETVDLVFGECSRFLSEDRLRRIVEQVGDKRCEYHLQYGCKFVDNPCEGPKSVEYYVKKITLDFLRLNCK